MSDISAEQVKNLRQKTGAGLMECKKALVDADGDVDEAVTILRKRGQAAAEKKAGRTTSEGLIGSYVHGGKIGVLIEVNCETDFVAKTPQFQELVKDLAMQVAAASPAPARFVRREDVPEEVLAKEREILRSQAESSGKPAQVIDKIVEGKLGKFYSEAVLLEQPFIKNADTTVAQHITSLISILKENIQVRRFARFERGEPI
ncbi:MAG: translation elongation factor Ts [Vicinamibacteria bacterium]